MNTTEFVQQALERNSRITALRERIAVQTKVAEVLDILVKWKEDLPPAFIKQMCAVLRAEEDKP